MMRKIHHITQKEQPIEKTINLKKLIGKNVLSKGGKIIGKVSEIRINPYSLRFEGILIKKDIFKKPIYIGKSYFSHLSHEAIILNIEPIVLINKKTVITSEGKIIGKVKKVIREGSTNNLKGIIVSSLFRKSFIPASVIKSVGTTIVLKPNYDAKKKYIWKENK